MLPAGAVPSAVHPHLRGEYVQVNGERVAVDGSPPPAWGIRGQPAPRRAGRRFTPTCVGNTVVVDQEHRRRLVHPHLRGEYAHPAAHVGVIDRFTPTCVGNTFAPPLHRHAPTVHPHLRGEYFLTSSMRACHFGSPPPAWGIRAGAQARVLARRFTPTCVGNTAGSRASAPAPPVHPHLRGEYATIYGGLYADFRFTPTCVGNTRARRAGRSAGSVHPHLRGEYGPDGGFMLAPTGSPPPAWGIQLVGGVEQGRQRFTPTCVGNTDAGELVPVARRFTPTCVGNTKAHDKQIVDGHGSPPPAWGIRPSSSS